MLTVRKFVLSAHTPFPDQSAFQVFLVVGSLACHRYSTLAVRKYKPR